MGTIIIVVTAAVATAEQWYQAYGLTYALPNAFFCICVFMVLVCIWVCHLYNGESAREMENGETKSKINGSPSIQLMK